MIKNIIKAMLAFFSIIPATALAQSADGVTYTLPQTALRFTLLVEKTTYTPGDLAHYAFRYMKLRNVSDQPRTSFRIVDIKMEPVGVPDTAKQYTLNLQKRYTIDHVDVNEQGMLLAINATGKRATQPSHFTPAPKPARINPHDFLNGDILSATSGAKMAELIAQDIYDIRDSRNQLSRGEADFMPKDGAQLKMMFQQLDTQEKALLQLFQGTIEKDTVEEVITCIPHEMTDHDVLFRLSQWDGIVDNDDLSGSPFYISVKGDVAPQQEPVEEKKKDRNDIGLRVNVPVKMHVTLSQDVTPIKQYDVMMGQFGALESLSGELFGKKLTTSIVFNPVTGGIEKIDNKSLE